MATNKPRSRASALLPVSGDIKIVGDGRTFWHWSNERSNAAILLAQGISQREVAAAVGVSDRSIRAWLAEPEFAEEVDRLSSMVDIASRAARLRIAMRAVRAKTSGDVIDTEKDLLDWLRYVQSETQGVKLDLSKIAATFD